MSDAEVDGDEVDMFARGTLSDQDLMPESDFMSGTEELGYEVSCFITCLVKGK